MGYRSEVAFAIAPPLVDKFLAVKKKKDEEAEEEANAQGNRRRKVKKTVTA